MKFEYPDDVRFTCQQCGDCCRGWNVPLAAGERERLEQLDWHGRIERLVDLSPAVRLEGPSGAVERLARREGEACVYLGDQNECLLHAHFGADSKPLACTMYPFSFRTIGDRVMVDAAFSCRAVNHGLGEPLAKSIDGWTGLRPDLLSLADAGGHRLTGHHSIEGDLLWEFEEQLGEYLGDRSMRLLDRLRSVLEYLRLATTGDPATPAAATLRTVMSKAVPGLIQNQPLQSSELDKSQRAVFLLWTYLVLNPAPIDIQSWDRGKQDREVSRRSANADRFREGKGKPSVDNRELNASFEEIDAVDVSLFDDDADAIVATFLRSKLIGQRFLFAAGEELPLVEAVQRLLLCYPIAIWSAKALAVGRGSNRAEEADLRAALRLIDRSFDQIRTAALESKQREAWEFVISETDLAVAVTRSLLSGGQ